MTVPPRLADRSDERATGSRTGKHPARRPCVRVQRRREAGFTLIELLVVLVILGLLAALAGPRVIGYLGGAKADTARLQIENLSAALDLYRLDTGNYPTSEQGLEALVERPSDATQWNGPYLDSNAVPEDPWGNDYHYERPGENGPYDLYSLGSDNRTGGEGEAADIRVDEV